VVWLESPLRLGVLTSLVAIAFVVARLLVAGHGNIASFILVGAEHARVSHLPSGVPVVAGSGYDGEMYYRLALDPLGWKLWDFGIQLDSPARIQRIAYPALAWLASGGHRSAVPVSMVAVNVAALGVLAGAGAATARDAGRRAWWGLIFPAYWGLLWSLSRDLTEIVTAASLMLALVGVRRRHPVLGGVALSVAVLSRETALVLVASLFAARAWGWARTIAGKRAGPGREGSTPVETTDALVAAPPGVVDVTWILPVLAFAGWQLVARARIGAFPLRVSGQANLGVPLAGLLRGAEYYIGRLPKTASLLWGGELIVLAVVGVFAATVFTSTRALLHERLAWIGYGVLSLSAAKGIWLGDVGFRRLDEFFLFSCVLLLFSSRRLPVPAALVAITWVVVSVELVLYI
jgi:hypothetical protein